jgi:predicted transcriptional regulator
VKLPPISEIKRLRKSLGITQNELSKGSGVSQSMIAKIEGNKTSPSYDTVVALFDALERMCDKGMKDLVAIDIASRKVVAVQSSEKVYSAAELMRSTGFSQLPVLSGETPVGSISERSIFDIMRRGKTMNELKDTLVSDVMGERFPLVGENTPLSSVTSMMSGSGAVLVAAKGKIIGVITSADLLKLI